MANSNLINISTPVGELHYVNISGQGKENYNEDGYEYTASVRLEGEKADKLIAEIEAVVETKPENLILKSKGYKELVKDKEGKLRAPTNNKPKTADEEATGIYEFNFKTGTTWPDGKTKQIGVYNSNAQKVSLGDKKVGNGSLGAISGKMEGKPYKKEWSVSLYLNNVQLVKFEEYEGDAGFEAQEGDFEGVEDAETGFTGQPEETANDAKADEPTKVKPKI